MVRPRRGETLLDLTTRFKRLLEQANALPVHVSAFGRVMAYPAGVEILRSALNGRDWPLTWVEGAGCDDSPVAGLQAFAVVDRGIQPVVLNGCTVGSIFEDASARHCLLGGIVPDNPSRSRGDQTRNTLDLVEQALGQAGFSLGDVVRTWFFLDRMLEWYPEFNRVRTERYSRVRFGSGAAPASTGVGARNPAGAALAVGVWAVQPKVTHFRAIEVGSPLQCPAPQYGSTFSRALELESEAGRRLFISGTASIAPGGETRFVGDLSGQVALSLEVVEAILESRGLDFGNILRSTAYFKHAGGAAAFQDWRFEHGLESMPVLQTQCDVCRDDLLFEFEADAWGPPIFSHPDGKR